MNDRNTNRLINETSPYLLQHAHNPVDWFAWGDEALQKAKAENKLLLISIGYSACHWCHVMEHESFENIEVAELMNANFVCIKVDREERPDVDQVYMDAVQLLTGHGGWPLNCFALPDGRPVYGGTYYRKNEWKSLLRQLSDLYKNQPDRLFTQAHAIQSKVISQEEAQVKVENHQLTKMNLQKAIRNMSPGFDQQNGGFHGAPKFPMPSIWNFILHYLQIEDDQPLKKQLLLTLDQLALGGIYDHAGGGFSRYSVDESWHIPHFEKMLYDNAQLVSLYSAAYSLTKNEHYKRVVYETLNFVRRELTTSNGAFYSALDADSEGVEGRYYAWAAEELKEILGNTYPLFAEYYSVTDDGNWEKGVNVLKAISSAKEFSAERNLRLNDFLCDLEIAETKLMVERNKRTRPGLDDKIIASWNALMLKGYIAAYRAFKNETFLEVALKNASFIKQNLIKNDFSMHRTCKSGISKINGFLDDYSFTISAFIDLYQITFDQDWLIMAKKLTNYTLIHFYDHQNEFFFYTSYLDEKLVVRKKELTDNVIPSSNSCMAGNLLLLSKYFNEPEYTDKALAMLNSRVYEVEQYARFYSNWGNVMLNALPQSREIVIIGADAFEIYSQFNLQNSPYVLFAVTANESDIPVFKDRFVQGKTLIYVCGNNTCKLPVQSVSEAMQLIGTTPF